MSFRVDAASDPIDTVYVSAQRRAAPLETVPISIATHSHQELAAAGLDSIGSLAEHVPVLDVQRSVGLATTTLRVRRVGALGNVPTLEPAVGLFVDGAYRQRSFLVADLLDINRVEVLAGPQSTLYGRNVSAGVIALYTREPTKEGSIWAELTSGTLDVGGSPSIFDMKAGVGGSLSGPILGSLAAAYSSHGHTMRNALPDMPDGDDQSRWAGRGQVLWKGGPMQIRLLAGYMEERDDQGESDVYLAPGSRTAGIAAALAQRGLAPPCPDNVPHNRRSCSIATNELDLTALDLTLIADAEWANGWTLTSMTAWDRFEVRRTEDDAVQLSAPILYFHDVQEGETIQQEFRLLSPSETPLSWLAGLYYYRNDFERGARGAEPIFGPNGPLALDPIWPLPFALPGQHGLHDSRMASEYWSVFGEATWRLSDRLHLIVGARWHEEDKDAGIENSLTVPGASVVSSILTPDVSPSGEAVNGRFRRSSDALTWSITPRLRLSEHAMAYATAARSTKGGGFNNGTGNAPLTAREFGDETIHHYELGARVAPANRRIELSGSVFHTEYHDYQDAIFLLAQFAVGNVEQADLDGFELAARAALGERTMLDTAVSYVDLEYARHTAGVCYPGRSPDGRLPQSCNLSGEHPLNAPQWETRVGLQHAMPVRWGEVFGRLDWSWTDRYHATFSADPRLKQDAHHNLNMRFGTRIGGAYELTLWARNALNENVVQIASTLNFFNDASWQSFLGEPRSYGVTLRASF